MIKRDSRHTPSGQLTLWRRVVLTLLCALLTVPPEAYAPPFMPGSAPEVETPLPVDSQKKDKKEKKKKEDPERSAPADTSVYLKAEMLIPAMLRSDTVRLPQDGRMIEDPDSTMTVVIDPSSPYAMNGKRIFNPQPKRAVWLSALFPGLGQIYNRRYWKLPIIVGGFMGLGYATSWNNSQYQDYTRGYRDLLDDDPDTKSYMDFFPPTVQESDLDQNWLSSTLKSRKDYYRRNRDLCIICVVGLYLLCMLDAYVDASLAHFDISPDLSMDVQPAVWLAPSKKPAFGLNWALTF